MKKRSILVVLALSTLLLSAMLQTSMAQQTKLRVVPDNITKYVNQSFQININVIDVTDLWAFQLNITWNSAILNLTDNDVHPPAVWGNNWIWGVNKTDNTAGLYTLAVTATGNTPTFNGNTSLVTLTYKAIGTGSTTIRFLKATTFLVNSTNKAIPYTPINGTVTVTTPPVGGVWVPINKLELIAPYIATAIMISIAMIFSAIYIKRRKKER